MIVHSPYGRRVHEPWAMAITTRIKQRYGFDGQVYAADDGIIIRLPDGDGNLPIRELLLFDMDELQRIIETQVGESVLYAARFRECAARSLFPATRQPRQTRPLMAAAAARGATAQRRPNSEELPAAVGNRTRMPTGRVRSARAETCDVRITLRRHLFE